MQRFLSSGRRATWFIPAGMAPVRPLFLHSGWIWNLKNCWVDQCLYISSVKLLFEHGLTFLIPEFTDKWQAQLPLVILSRSLRLLTLGRKMVQMSTKDLVRSIPRFLFPCVLKILLWLLSGNLSRRADLDRFLGFQLCWYRVHSGSTWACRLKSSEREFME